MPDPEDYYQAIDEYSFRKPVAKGVKRNRKHVHITIIPKTWTELRKMITIQTGGAGCASGFVETMLYIAFIMLSKDPSQHKDRLDDIAHTFWRAYKNSNILDNIASNMEYVADAIRNRDEVERQLIAAERAKHSAIVREKKEKDSRLRKQRYKEKLGKYKKQKIRDEVELRTVDDLLEMED
jgi:hypothetical protein